MLWFIAIVAACGFFASGCHALTGAFRVPVNRLEEARSERELLNGVLGMIVCGLIVGGCLEHLL